MKNILTIFLAFITPYLLYSQIYDDYIGAGHAQGVIVSSSDAENEDTQTISGAGVDEDLAGASRFLSHATLGATLEDIRYVNTIGYEAWLDEQFAMPATSYEETMVPIDEKLQEIYLTLGGDPEEYYASAQHFRLAWSHIAQTAPDVLRHRIALALSEIMVISTDSDLFQRGYGIANYYDMLSKHSFGNFKDLLMDVTLHPTMGFYLSHFNNPKSDPANNIQPDENYAREIMQLFSIGLYELNLDGTRKLDVDGNYIPTYDNDDIKELAKVFTGLGMTKWIDEDIMIPEAFGYPFYYIDPTEPMTMYEAFHEPGEKTLLGDFTIPAGQTGMEDIEMAVDHLFNHPNVAPFISKLLIQRLVKSNPRLAYVYRVANVFNDNGNGVRGDMEAVIRAILTDEEARGCEWIDHPSNGRLKEPIQRYTQYVKAFRANSPSGWFWNQGFNFEYFVDQFPMSSPSVFNFFLPDYQPNSDFADEEMFGPEFQIFNSATSIGYFNYMFYMTVIDYNNELPINEQMAAQFPGFLEDYTATLSIPDLEALNTDAKAVVDYLDLVMAHGNMSQETRDIIVATSEPLIAAPQFLLKMATYLTMISPDFAVMK